MPSDGQPLTADELADLRAANRDRGFHREDLDPDPTVQFTRWYEEWRASGAYNPESVVVATARSDGRPSARTVLLRGIDERGFVFYTNYESRKGVELAENAQAALCFPWIVLDRQVRVVGRVEHTGVHESDAYWATRQRGNQIAGSVSDQSRPVADRATLQRRFDELAERFSGKPVPRPSHWGGYRVVPEELEFWQSGPDRRHDCFRYRRPEVPALPSTDGTPAPAPNEHGWIVERLMP